MKKYVLVLAALCGLGLCAAAPKAEAFVSFSFGVGGYPYYGCAPAYYGYGPAYYGGGYYPGYASYGYYGPRYYRHYGGRRVVVYRHGPRYYRRNRHVAYYR